MKRRIEQLKALSLDEWRLLLTVMVLLPIVALSLRIKGFKGTQNSMRSLMPKESALMEPDESELKNARGIARMIAVAAGHGVYRANCLKQSLVLWWMLARRGIKSEIVFGVQKEAIEHFDAHAWVECNGINLSDSEEVQQRFAAFQTNSEKLGMGGEE